MCKYIIILLISFPVSANNFYFAGGIAIHNNSLDGPEIHLDVVLGTLELGYEHAFNPYVDIQFYGAHTSGIATKEEGLGFNKLGIKIKSKF